MLPPKVRPIWLDLPSAPRENDVLVMVKNGNDVLASAPPKHRRERRAPVQNLAENDVLASAPPKPLKCSPQTIAEAVDIIGESGPMHDRIGLDRTIRGRSAGAARPRRCDSAGTSCWSLEAIDPAFACPPVAPLRASGGRRWAHDFPGESGISGSAPARRADAGWCIVWRWR